MKVAISLAKVTVPLKSDEVDFVSALVPKPQLSCSLDHATGLGSAAEWVYTTSDRVTGRALYAWVSR